MNRSNITRKSQRRGIFALLGTIGALILGGMGVKNVAAETVEITADVKPVLQVLLPSEQILLNLNPSTSADAFAEQNYQVMVGTNHIAGYTLSLTSSNGTDLTRTELGPDGSYAKIPTLTEKSGGYATEADFTVNHWGFKQGTENYNAFKTNYILSQSDGPVQGDTVDLGFAAKVDLTQPSGTYNLSVDFTAIAKVILGVETIIFDANGGTGSMTNQVLVAPGGNLAANTFTNGDELVFDGWNTKADGTGTKYADGANYAVASDAEIKTTVLYAQWAEAGFKSYTKARCQAEASSAPVTLTDRRNNKDYRVRYINGICTMIDNLDLELTTGMVLTPDTTNVTTTRTLGTVGSLTTNDNAGSYNQVRTARNTGVPGAGLHYNYAAATAGTITGSSNTAEATQDICPAGWRLPTGGQNQEQFILNNSYTWQQWNSNFPTAFAPVAAGFYYNGSLGNSGSYGLWWSSTANDTTNRYNLYYKTSNGLYSGVSYNRIFGNSVRCVLK